MAMPESSHDPRIDLNVGYANNLLDGLRSIGGSECDFVSVPVYEYDKEGKTFPKDTYLKLIFEPSATPSFALVVLEKCTGRSNPNMLKSFLLVLGGSAENGFVKKLRCVGSVGVTREDISQTLSAMCAAVLFHKKSLQAVQ